MLRLTYRPGHCDRPARGERVRPDPSKASRRVPGGRRPGAWPATLPYTDRAFSRPPCMNGPLHRPKSL
ncbi:hypothetical protein E2C01_088195 [Portunus trituberculatus]|uniref:Uncharacterized protein n=1 Tax=Portunus trituberculatus TaxID=210409 RepID=A0A5B7JDU0_PORTR|nr:hypothetical protein [Portunus trituberculatus]